MPRSLNLIGKIKEILPLKNKVLKVNTIKIKILNKRNNMKKIFIAAILSLSIISSSVYAEIKMGIILGFTGPIESLNSSYGSFCRISF